MRKRLYLECDDELLERCNEIWEKVKKDPKKNLIVNREP